MADYPIYRSVYSAAQIEASIGKTPIIDSTSREWKVWDINTGAYVGTGIIAESAASAQQAQAAALTAHQASSDALGARGAALQAQAAAEAAADRAEAAAADLDETNRRALGAYPTESASGPAASFADGADGIPVKALTVAVEPEQNGSGDPTPTNIRQIVGYESIKVLRAGKNLIYAPTNIDATYRGITFARTDDDRLHISGTAFGGDASINTGTTWSTALYGPYPAGTYTITARGLIGASATDRVVFGAIYRDNTDVGGTAGGVRISGPLGQIADGAGAPKTFTATAPFKIYLSFTIADGSTVDSTVSFSLQLGETADAWEAYAGTSFVFELPTEAGTVYGGNLDATGKRLTVDRAAINLGTLSWGRNANGFFYSTGLQGVIDGSRNAGLCSRYTLSSQTASAMPDYHFRIETGTSGNGAVYVKDQRFETAADFKSGVSGAILVYYLAAPVVYDLDDAPEVVTALGVNTIWSEAGDVDVTIRADPNLYIDERVNNIMATIANI